MLLEILLLGKNAQMLHQTSRLAISRPKPFCLGHMETHNYLKWLSWQDAWFSKSNIFKPLVTPSHLYTTGNAVLHRLHHKCQSSICSESLSLCLSLNAIWSAWTILNWLAPEPLTLSGKQAQQDLKRPHISSMYGYFHSTELRRASSHRSRSGC